ncbi:hypothetical protein JOM56_013823 [Amanita muscaria]
MDTVGKNVRCRKYRQPPRSRLASTDEINSLDKGAASSVGKGSDELLHYCHIAPQAEQGTWNDLRDRGWIPFETKKLCQHEPRNGLLHALFDGFLSASSESDFPLLNKYSFTRTVQIQRFVFVNYSSKPTLQKFHGKTVALDTTDRQRPYAVSFLVHLS